MSDVKQITAEIAERLEVLSQMAGGRDPYPDRLVDYEDARKFLGGISKSKLLEYVRSGELPTVDLGRNLPKISLADLRMFVAKRKGATA